jgi:invasion protein IalB
MVVKKNMKFIALGLALVVAAVGVFTLTSQSVSGQEEKAAAAAAPVDGTQMIKQADIPASEQPWKVRCSSEEASKAEQKRGKCEVFQQLIVQETKKRFAEFAIGFPEGQKEARGIMILPLGVLLEPGVEMQIDDQQPFKFKVRYCEPGGCAAFLSLNDSVLNMLKNGKVAKVSLQSAQGKTLSFDLSLKGFADVFKQVS